jgi:DNA-binding CsgD family transcriptional regulator
MGWISEIAHKTRTLPIPGALTDRLHLKRHTHGAAERDELLVKIDILTAKNNELKQIAHLDTAQQKNQVSKEEIEILRRIAEENVASAHEIADALDISLARAEYRLTQLLDHGYVVDNATLNYHAFLLDRRGREYLVENNLHRFDFQSKT